MHPAPPYISPLSLHDALPISRFPVATLRLLSPLALADGPVAMLTLSSPLALVPAPVAMLKLPLPLALADNPVAMLPPLDRKSTRLNSSHLGISYAVFCLKKKK